MSVGRICMRQVDVATPDESVQVAARRMSSRKVGSLLVLNESGQPIGILTDRDLAIHVVGEALDPGTTTIGDVMTIAPDSVQEDTPIESALARMRQGPYRRLPVVDAQGKLAGVVSLDDILELLSEEFAEIGRLLKNESPGSLAEL